MEIEEINIFSNLNQNHQMEFNEDNESSIYTNSCLNHCASSTKSKDDSMNSFLHKELNVNNEISNNYHNNSAEEGKNIIYFLIIFRYYGCY